ncbi:MAG: hypothetical protein KDD67_16600 [Ignavibacteriae bacterium]|nr:hypothetical protein [Ignavibacteriota bacterium]MCB9217352.1 hypothetical protein [Ignavibacteria bacterium]
MNINRILLTLSLFLIGVAALPAQPYDQLPAPGDTPPPPMPVITPPALNFGFSLLSPTPTLWLWGGYDGTPPQQGGPLKFIQPSVGLELYNVNRASLGRTEWGIAELPMQFSSFADPQDAVLMAEEGEDLIFTVRHNFLNFPCGHAGNDPLAHPTSHGSIRFGTRHHVCLPPDPNNPNLPDYNSPDYQLFQHDLERLTIQSNGMVGIHVPEPQRVLHVSNRWGHEAAIRISNDQYSDPYDHLNQHVATLGIAELAVPSAGGLFSTIADANDFVIRTAGGAGNPASDIILTAHNAGSSLRFATAKAQSVEEERLTVQNGGDVTIGGSVGIGFQPNQSLLSDPVNWQQQRKLDVRGGQVGVTPLADEAGVFTIMPSQDGSWWNMANIMNGGMLAFMAGDMLKNVPNEVDINGNIDPVQVRTQWASAPMVISSNGVVGMGTVDPDPYSALHVHNKPVRLSKTGTDANLQIAIAGNNGDYSANSTPGDIIMRTTGGTTTEDLIIASSNNGASLKFATSSASGGDNNVRMTIFENGNVGIGLAEGTSAPYARLAVKGTICAEEVKVLLTSTDDAACWDWPDYVFDESYELMPLEELEAWVKTRRHLPNVPSQLDVEKNGIGVGEMQAQLLRKVEELTLYVIEQNKRIADLEAEVKAAQQQN